MLYRRWGHQYLLGQCQHLCDSCVANPGKSDKVVLARMSNWVGLKKGAQRACQGFSLLVEQRYSSLSWSVMTDNTDNAGLLWTIFEENSTKK